MRTALVGVGSHSLWLSAAAGKVFVARDFLGKPKKEEALSVVDALKDVKINRDHLLRKLEQ